MKLALDTLNQLPETHERDKRELDFLLLLGPCLTAAEGYATPEVEHIFNRAQELCKQLEDEAHRATVLWNLAGFRYTRIGRKVVGVFRPCKTAISVVCQ